MTVILVSPQQYLDLIPRQIVMFYRAYGKDFRFQVDSYLAGQPFAYIIDEESFTNNHIYNGVF
jgi:hypothetical protein